MSIAKLFVRVFGEDIFEKLSQELQAKEDGDTEHDQTCTNEPTPASTVKVSDMALPEQVTHVKSWLQEKIDILDLHYEELMKTQVAYTRQRLGSDLAVFDIDYTTSVRMSTDRLALRSHGNFDTMLCNVCVFGGCWMYEVQLHTKGVMQLGWASGRCLFNDNRGVGDTRLSYGFDGSKQQIWHIATKKYGDKWQEGDIIGITIDIDNHKIEYYRNGKSMGVAFDKLEIGPGVSFFPAVSLAYNQAIQANFGNMPFKFPIEGYLPIQRKPVMQMEKAELLLNYLGNLAIAITPRCSKDKKSKDDKDKSALSTKKTVYVVFCSLLMEKLSSVLFDAYIIEDVLLAEIKRLIAYRTEEEKDSNLPPGSIDSPLGSFLSLFWNYVELEENKFIFKKLVNGLLSNYTITNKTLDYERQKQSLHILTCICNHPRTRKSLLDMKFFKKNCLPLFLYIRPPEFSYMKFFIPDNTAWTEGIEGPKGKYLSLVERISKATESLYGMQKNLLLILLNNNDGDMDTPSSRKIFLIRLRRYYLEASMEQRPFHHYLLMQSSILHPLEPKIALSFNCILIDVVRLLFEKEMSGVPVEVDPKLFYDGTLEYFHFDRIGGVLSHLRKVHLSDIAERLGPERAQQMIEEERTGGMQTIDEIEIGLSVTTGGVPLIARRNNGQPTRVFAQYINPKYNEVTEPSPGNREQNLSLYELLDLAILYYYSVGHRYVVKISTTRDEIATLNEVLLETKQYRDDMQRKLKVLEKHAKDCLGDSHCRTVSELREKFGQRENVFAKRSIELARKQAWFRAVALGKHRRLLLTWFLEKILRTLNASSRLGPLFAFLPEIYINILPILLDTVMDFSHHDLLNQFDIADSECAVNAAADFLGFHSADRRIILASCKDSLLQGLGTLTSHRSGVRALERSPPSSQAELVKALLRPYENRAWGQSNWLLLRFWLGEGYAYRDSRMPCVFQGGNFPVTKGLCRSRARGESHTGLLHNIAPANPSKHFQKIIGAKLKGDEPYATAFLNSVLGQLNWAFSEFILLLQEIQNTANRTENSMADGKQFKICSMCFELTVSLMRCLEMTISVAPDIFEDPTRPNGDLILNRVCQLCSQVLSRVTVPPGCFQFVVDLCSADLSSVTHFPIITAALGILLALMRREMESDKQPAKVTRLTRALLTDPSFQFANLEFALGEIKTPILQQAEIPRGNFDPQTRAHIDPLTNEVRVPMPASTAKRIRVHLPVIKFSLADFPTHVTVQEVDEVRRLIEMLRVKQALLSDITLPSEDSLCPICCAKPIACIFLPCRHQSCSNCILQHLMNSKVCFYCKTMIQSIEMCCDGNVIYRNNEYITPPRLCDLP